MRWPRFFPGVLPSAAVRLFYFQHGIFFNERMCQMNFKEALIAHLQGQKVEVFHTVTGVKKLWEELIDENYFGALISGADKLYSFRLAPRTILVNGVEVPAPETVAPADGSGYYTPHVTREQGYSKDTWDGASFDLHVLEQGLVYLNKEDAIARAKAMLITQEVK